MTKKEVIEQIKNKTNMMNVLKNEGKIDEAYKVMNEIELHEKELKIIDKTEQNVTNSDLKNLTKIVEPNKNKSFANIIKNITPNYNGTDDGMLVPEDQQKKINDLKVDNDSLQDLITVKKALAPTGSYIVRRKGSNKLTKTNQGGKITPMAKANFELRTYAIEDYKGLIPVTSQFLEDTAENMESFMRAELAEAGAETVRAEVLTILDTFTPETIVDISDLKALTIKGFNKELLKGASWIIGQSTLAYLYTLKDVNGRFLVEQDLTKADGLVLFGKPIKVLSDIDMPEGKIHFGNFKEAVYEFDLEQTKIAKSVDFGFDEDVVYFRAVERFDIVKNDENASKVITFTIPSPVATLSRNKK